MYESHSSAGIIDRLFDPENSVILWLPISRDGDILSFPPLSAFIPIGEQEDDRFDRPWEQREELRIQPIDIVELSLR